ncbi:nucleolar protein 9 [Sabethes cyaneus]|uniref:nucleolar protein 9 n=1 Tax=Sabethes cyaneus TaxID=53552 RepID=UPI00237E7CF7|nr:nucleolar protein 9 [Sabethes cyaneus]
MATDSENLSAPQVGTNYAKNRNKKRKSAGKRFLQNAKGFGRKNSFGRGAELDQEEYSYFVGILEAITAIGGGGEDGTEDELCTMANNVYEQIGGKEIKTASNQLSSRVLEHLLGFTDEVTLQHLMTQFGDNFRVVCCDKFASHVLQKLLFVAMLRCVGALQVKQDGTAAKKQRSDISREIDYNLAQEFSADHRKLCAKFVKKVAKFLLNNLEEFVWDPFGNYVIRQCILNLAGIAELKIGKGESSEVRKLVVPDKWFKLINEFCSRLLAWPQFGELPFSEFTSALLQSLLASLDRAEDKFQLLQLSEKLLDSFLPETPPADETEQTESESTKQLPKVFQQDSSIRLLEALLPVVDSDFLKNQLYKKVFQGNIAALSQSRMANFAIQKLLNNVSDKHVLELIFSELDEGLEEILKLGHTGIVASLAKACSRLACQQGKFVKLLLDALHCSETAGEKLLTSVLKLMPPEVLTEQPSAAINLHGSIILQSVLDFNKPIKMVAAILDTKNDHLAKIFTDPKGSFVANAFVGSKFVGEKSREKLIRHLEGCYMDLALSLHGSHVLELLYDAGSQAQKEAIVRELSERVGQLNSKPWGKIINQKLRVDGYRQNPAQWKNTKLTGQQPAEKAVDVGRSSKKRK